MPRPRPLTPSRVLGLGLVALTVALGACERSTPAGADGSPTASSRLTLAQLEGGDRAKASGRALMALPEGMHRLDTAAETTAAVVGVHGWDSKGYEWAYPLSAVADPHTQVHFYRWDYQQCPEPAAAALDAAIDDLLKGAPAVTSLRLIAHSYGGVVAARVAARYDGAVPLTVDLVASPLAGVSSIERRCGELGATAPAPGAPVTLRQWRTRHALDKAFADLEPDPQVVELPGEVTRLPETYRGHRLGHNWSISWVVDHLAGGAPP